VDNEIIPGTSIGAWRLGMSRIDVIELLEKSSSEYTEVAPGGFDFINSKSLSLCFDTNQSLNQVCVVSADEGAKFRGVGLGSEVNELASLGHVVSIDLADRLLVIKNLPGIFFNFENDEIDYEFAEEVCFEGDDGQLRDLIRPEEILRSRIDRICITIDPELNPMFDLNP